MRYVSLFIFCMFLVFIIGCSSDDPMEVIEEAEDSDEYVELVRKAQAEEPKEKIFMEELSYQITEQLMMNIDLIDSRAPLGVTTPVLASNFRETVSLSYQLQQGLINELHSNQFFVVDMNLADYIKITDDGEFMLSRKWESVPRQVEIQLVLLTTLVPDKGGISINVRIVNIFSRRVVASAMTYVRLKDMENVFTLSRTVVSNEDGVLEQNDKEGDSAVYIIDEYTE